MRAVTVTVGEAARILSGEQTIYTTAERPEIASGERVALVVDDAVVCTVTVQDALPICGDSHDDDHGLPLIWNDENGSDLWLMEFVPPTLPDMDPERSTDISDQLPLGDFTPGRWGWLLGDPQPPTTWRCGRGLPEDRCRYYHQGDDDEHGCRRVPSDPIPVKGRQGVFELPADVAEVLR